jgi:hypothetical protein
VFASVAFMQPPLKLLPPMAAHEMPLTMPVNVFIQVGGVHGLAQNLTLGLTVFAAFTYGMRYIMSREIEKLDSAVSPAVSSSV